MRLIDYLDKGAELGRDAPCIVQGDQRWSYSEVIERTHQIACACARAGFGKGSKAAVLSPNEPDTLMSILGILRAEMIWLPINPRYTLDDITELLHRFDCELLIVHPSFEPAIDQIRAVAPGIRLILTLGEGNDVVASLEGWLEPPGSRHEGSAPNAEDVCAIMTTGGTTGRPKGVLQTNRGFETYVANHIATMGHDERPKYLVVAPLTHAAGFMCFSMLARGGTIFIAVGTEPRTVADAMSHHGITDLFAPPTLIYTMLADPEIRAMRFPALKCLLYGAAPMSVEKLREALEWLGPVMYQGFAQVEAIMICTVLRPQDHFIDGQIAGPERLSSCGRPAPFVMMAVMNEEGELLPDGSVGEIVVRSGNVMLGYYKDPAASAEASRFGWHHTGDIGFRDEEGFYHLVDRARDMIISGGYNIYPSEIEQVLWGHPAVQDCAVVGAPDPKWGEAVTAVVQLKAGETVDAAELVSLCRIRVGSIKAPKTILFWPELPRSPVGKVLKRDIRDKLWAGQARRI
ncbi:class I adenylate-forming enzyme family protein [Sphingobium amiense]|nr:AMP-binding protein [Sphingobium amiense]